MPCRKRSKGDSKRSKGDIKRSKGDIALIDSLPQYGVKVIKALCPPLISQGLDEGIVIGRLVIDGLAAVAPVEDMIPHPPMEARAVRGIDI